MSSELAPKYEVQYGASFEDALKAAGISFDEALAPEVTESTEQVQPDPAVQASPAAPEPVQQVAPTPPAPTTPEPAPPDPKFQALLEREARAIEREQALKAAESDLLELRRRLDEFEAAKAQFLADPHGYIRTLAPEADPDEIAKDVWYGKLPPSQQPPEYRAHKEARKAQLEAQKLRTEFGQLTQRQSEEQARMEAERREAQFVDGLKGYASSVPDKYHLVQALTKQSGPDVAVDLLYDAARMIAAQGRQPTAEEAADAVQKYLARIGYAAAPAQTDPAPAAPPPASAPPGPPTTLRNSHTAVQAARTPLNENDPAVLRQRAYQAMAAAMGDESLARLPVE